LKSKLVEQDTRLITFDLHIEHYRMTWASAAGGGGVPPEFSYMVQI